MLGFIALLLYYLTPYFWTYRHLRNIPAPFAAQFTNLWLLYTCRKAKRCEYIHDAHKHLGPVVRIQPNHVSIADPEAIQVIYGHGNGLLKSSWYDAFVSVGRSIFNTRDRAAHARKRKIVSHTFSPRTVRQLEPYVQQKIEVFVNRWDQIATEERRQTDGYAQIECRQWFNFLAFDIIGDLAFGAPFGMLQAGNDIVEVRTSLDASPTYLPAVTALTRRSEIAATIGAIPELKPYAKWIPDPFFHKGIAGVQNLTGIAIARVKHRIENPSLNKERKDLLALLQEGRDDKGEYFGFEELAAEALTLLIAGSDTTSNTFCAMMYHVASTPRVLKKLQEELDLALPGDVKVPSFEMGSAFHGKFHKSLGGFIFEDTISLEAQFSVCQVTRFTIPGRSGGQT
ncbi:putative Benzoate 4-monooxygenase [Seiridium cardinale]|uniref:Benzoate 4-monooxygenase n=1 Tax=Seiridium cardinale TaxID=138064 RepID=A0ABR2Y3L8_9PEZI